MVATGRRALWSLCVCFAALHTNALRVTMRVSTVEVVRGDFVILPCSFYTSSPLSRLNIIWTLAPLSSPESPIQVIVYDHGQIIEDPSLIGRVGFTGIPWSADIMVNDTRVSDAGIYRCMVNNPPEMADPGIGELLLTVLGELSGSVQIANVSSQTSGLYRCSASNLLGTENCYINLSIHSEVGESSSGILQGVLLTLAMSLMLLSLLVLVIWLHQTGQDGRRRVSKMEEEEEEGYNEIQYTPSLMKRSFV
ncbi:immunoglobulin superfamily member 11 isoform X2 [Syngnathoides biaculeatus]|uniref:immunoglobulin superfamily member 11 isoform X2 n=1 Tax=Syngnathoides biaculeatus TaxID=300417 RepID=UPI002ADD9E53|nr:immunoglobulin superfamily member 11 isoform X2 [Syngnathoides biaculeatus]